MESQSQFAKSFRAKLDSFSKGLSADPGSLRSLNEADALNVLEFLLESVTKSQSTEATALGIEYLARLPRRWTLQRLLQIVPKKLDLSDDYEFRRLLDLYEHLDVIAIDSPELEKTIAQIVELGLASTNADIREDAEAFHKKRERVPRLRATHEFPKRRPVAVAVSVEEMRK